MWQDKLFFYPRNLAFYRLHSQGWTQIAFLALFAFRLGVNYLFQSLFPPNILPMVLSGSVSAQEIMKILPPDRLGGFLLACFSLGFFTFLIVYRYADIYAMEHYAYALNHYGLAVSLEQEMNKASTIEEDPLLEENGESNTEAVRVRILREKARLGSWSAKEKLMQEYLKKQVPQLHQPGDMVQLLTFVGAQKVKQGLQLANQIFQANRSKNRAKSDSQPVQVYHTDSDDFEETDEATIIDLLPRSDLIIELNAINYLSPDFSEVNGRKLPGEGPFSHQLNNIPGRTLRPFYQHFFFLVLCFFFFLCLAAVSPFLFMIPLFYFGSTYAFAPLFQRYFSLGVRWSFKASRKATSFLKLPLLFGFFKQYVTLNLAFALIFTIMPKGTAPMVLLAMSAFAFAFQILAFAHFLGIAFLVVGGPSFQLLYETAHNEAPQTEDPEHNPLQGEVA